MKPGPVHNTAISVLVSIALIAAFLFLVVGSGPNFIYYIFPVIILVSLVVFVLSYIFRK